MSSDITLFVPQYTRHLALYDTQSKPFDNSRLAHTRLSDKHRIVLSCDGSISASDALSLRIAAITGQDAPPRPHVSYHCRIYQAPECRCHDVRQPAGKKMAHSAGKNPTKLCLTMSPAYRHLHHLHPSPNDVPILWSISHVGEQFIDSLIGDSGINKCTERLQFPVPPYYGREPATDAQSRQSRSSASWPQAR